MRAVERSQSRHPGQGGGQGSLWQERASMFHLKELYLSFVLLQIQLSGL